jgi:transglutaminase-like putative cysteine protease
MIYRINCVVCLLFLFTNSFSNSLPKDDQNIVINECTQTFTYKIKDQKVIVEETKETFYTCTQFKSSATISTLFNNDITIDNIRIKSKGGNSKPQYRPYFAEKIANTDEKICYFDLYFARKGETASVKLEETFHDIHYFNRVYFTEPFYVQNKIIRFVVPRWMKMEIIPKNQGENISQAVSYDASNDTDIFTYQIKESEAWIKKDEYAPGISYVYPHFLIINHSVDYKEFHEDYFNSLQDLYNWNRQLILSLENDENVIRQFAQEITANATSDLEKIKIIYEWVQENIRYLADNSGMAGFKPEPAQDVLQKKYGDCKGMANLLKHLLKALGFDARLAWIGTNDVAYDFSQPTLSAINHIICALFREDSIYYLDATVKYLAFKDYSETIQGRQVMIENGDNYFSYTVPVKDPVQNTEIEKSVFSIENQTLTGNVSLSFKGESKNYLLYSIHATLKDKLKEELQAYLSKYNAKYELSNLKMSNMQASEEEIWITYDVKNRADINSYNDKYFINSDFRQEFNNLTIDTTERKLDFWLPRKYHVVQQCEIIIPTGMTTESLPEDFLLERDGYTFHIQYTQSENKLFYNKTLIIRNPRITKNLFAEWNSDIERLKACYREQIVLIKKE